MISVTVIGLGYVGLPSAALIANAGYQVHGVDLNEDLIAELRAGECRLEEEAVKEVVHEALASGQLKASTTPTQADVFIICVPTPVRPDKTPDLTMVAAAMKSTAPYVKKGDLVILESTSPIGTTQNVVGAALKEVGLDPVEDVDICYCPERVFPGDTVREILENDRVVGGLTRRAATRAREFYMSFCKGDPNVTTASAAEFSKLMENTYRDVNIALANVFAHIAEAADVDVMEVIRMANKHPRVNVHTPGPGVGGHCIPVDPWFLIDGFPEQTELLKRSRNINDGQAEHFLRMAEEHGLQPGAKVAILGAAYRGDIDDARDTPTELLIKALGDAGYTYATHDPHVVRMTMHCGHPSNLTNDLEAALSGADAAFIITDHTAYKFLSPSDFDRMNTPMVVDTRRVLKDELFHESDLKILRAGAPAVSP